MMDYVLMKLTAIQVEWNWYFITRYRCRLNRLAEAGTPLTSDKLIALTRKIAKHCTKAMRYEKISKAITSEMNLAQSASRYKAKKAA